MKTKKLYDEFTGKYIDVIDVEDVYEEMESLRTEFKIKKDIIKKEILDNFDLISEEVYWDKKVQTNTIEEQKFIAMVNKVFRVRDEK